MHWPGSAAITDGRRSGRRVCSTGSARRPAHPPLTGPGTARSVRRWAAPCPARGTSPQTPTRHACRWDPPRTFPARRSSKPPARPGSPAPGSAGRGHPWWRGGGHRLPIGVDRSGRAPRTPAVTGLGIRHSGSSRGSLSRRPGQAQRRESRRGGRSRRLRHQCGRDRKGQKGTGSARVMDGRSIPPTRAARPFRIPHGLRQCPQGPPVPAREGAPA